jgi:signal transduction histidine kinase
VAERRRASIRLRITAVASAIVAAVLVVGALIFVGALRQALVDGVRATVESEASSIADRLEGGGPPELRPEEAEADDRLVQLVRDGSVIAASDEAEGLPPLATAEGSAVIRIPGDDDSALIVAEETGDALVIVGRDLSGVDESVGTVVPLVALSIPVLVALVAVTTWTVVGRALRPVERMRRDVDEVTSSRLDRRLDGDDATDELGRLAATMNRMLDRLDESQRTQRRFVSDASHELRSPLASLRQYAEVARAYPDRMTAAELAEAIDDEGARLEQIVRGMLVLARADEGSLRGATQPVDLDDLVLAEASRLRASTSLTVDVAVEPSRVEGDAGLLAQALRNLVDNAARHANARVALGLTAAGVITVDDDGPGIPPSERERVFDRFVRLDDARARDAGGSGLGLAIVQEIVRAHRGTVTASESPLGGARFTVTLR